jgi:hypothetical protein
MALKVIGAGLGRTGTHSLKVGLEKLLGSPCYHMVEVFQHPAHIPMWHAAANGEAVDWDLLFTGFSASVDWPSGSFYKELMEAYPDAIVVHSTRDSEAWWKSADATIFSGIELRPDDGSGWLDMIMAVLGHGFTRDIRCKEACIAAFEKFNAEVLATVPPEKLVIWRATDGWEPLCKALGVPVPSEPFPLTNTTEEFVARVKAQRAGAGPPH